MPRFSYNHGTFQTVYDCEPDETVTANEAAAMALIDIAHDFRDFAANFSGNQIESIAGYLHAISGSIKETR